MTQRIAIVRAILKNAPILALGEAISSLDSHTEQEVQKSINTMLDIENVTIIAIYSPQIIYYQAYDG
ncbi:MAG: hypothetical protein AB8U53_03370 [Rickettsia aeschlimannii]